jgi:hypothetical protein
MRKLVLSIQTRLLLLTTIWNREKNMPNHIFSLSIKKDPERYFRMIVDEYLLEHCAYRFSEFQKMFDPRKRKQIVMNSKTISSRKLFKIDRHQNQPLETGGRLSITGSQHPFPCAHILLEIDAESPLPTEQQLTGQPTGPIETWTATDPTHPTSLSALDDYHGGLYHSYSLDKFTHSFF